MWFPDDKMDINRFILVDIPRKSDYIQRFGFKSSPSTSYTGDEFAPLPKDKITSIADLEQYDAMMLREEMKKQESENAKSREEMKTKESENVKS